MVRPIGLELRRVREDFLVLFKRVNAEIYRITTMPDPDYLLAKRIYSLSDRFYLLISWAILSLAALFMFALNFYFPSIAFFGLSFAVFVLIEGFLSPFVVIGSWRTWRSLSEWRRAFLKFSLTVSLETTPVETANPRVSLFHALVASNPEYEDILDEEWTDKETGVTKAIGLIPGIENMFENVKITEGERSVIFDLLIGKLAFPEKEKGIESALRKSFSYVNMAVARIVEGLPSFDDYRRFSEDIKILTKKTGNENISRALLVSTLPPSEDLIQYAKNKKNWPGERFLLSRMPIDLVVQEERGYRVVLAN